MEEQQIKKEIARLTYDLKYLKLMGLKKQESQIKERLSFFEKELDKVLIDE